MIAPSQAGDCGNSRSLSKTRNQDCAPGGRQGQDGEGCGVRESQFALFGEGFAFPRAVPALVLHEQESTVVLDQSFQIGRRFGASGTPSAVLIDREGQIASSVAVGAPAVFELAGRRPSPTTM